MATQYFKRNLLLNLYREEKNITSFSSCRLREIKMSDTCRLFPPFGDPWPSCLLPSHHLLFDHFQFTLIHGCNIPGSYAILLFTISDLTSITSHSHNWVLFCFGSVSSFFLELFLHWSPLTYWAPTNLGRSSFIVLYFCLFIISWGSQSKNTEVVCHSLLYRTMFCQNSPPWPVCLGWPYIVSLS